MNPLKSKKKILGSLGKTWSRFSKSFWKTASLLIRKKSGRLDQSRVDQNLVYTLASSKIPNSEQIKQLDKTLSTKERLIIRICLAIVLVNVVYLGIRYYNNHVTYLPVAGGIYREGVIGYPQTINPLYSVNRDVDSDLTRLVYSSLFAYNEQGNLVGDLASNVETTDNKEFLITIRPGVKWHSGEDLIVDDVIFTFNLIQNPEYRSPLRKNFAGVEVTRVSDNSVKFVLPTAYSFFPSFLTFGIMPQSVWENIAPGSANLNELNLQPIGSGPYKFSSLLKDKSGELKEYRLLANDDYYGAKPYIKEVIFKFFPDSTEMINALNAGDVQGIAHLSVDQKKSLLAQNSLRFNLLSSSQESLIFINSANNKNLADLEVRKALALAIDKQTIVRDNFFDFYKVLNGPLPDSAPLYNNEIDKYDFNLAAANSKLDQAGWQSIMVQATDLTVANLSPELKAISDYASGTKEVIDGSWRFKKDKKGSVSLLTVTLTAVDNGDGLMVAQRVKDFWNAIGVRTSLNLVSSDEATNVAMSRDFEAMFYSELIGSNPDLFFFWHSSQIGSRGLNIAAYHNGTVDKLLEEIRTSVDNNVKNNNYRAIQKIIASELPVIFLYENNYLYVQSQKLKGFGTTAISDPSDRFSGISSWYLKTKNKFSF